MKFKKIIAGVAIACGFLGLAACNDSGKVNPPAGEPSTSQQGEPSTSVQINEVTLPFLTNGKARIDIDMPGCTFKLNGTAITSGQTVDIGNFTLTYEGTLTEEVFHVYWASVKTNGTNIKVHGGIETEHMSEFFTGIFPDLHVAQDQRIYLCITKTRLGWTHNLDTIMDRQLTAMAG